VYVMNDADNETLESIKVRLIAGMTGYMEDSDGSAYTEAEIKKCEVILSRFIAGLEQLGASAGDPAILKCVEQTVKDLNVLNDSTGGVLIETDQREDLCEYILLAAKKSGLSRNDDVTEEWREW
jgi:hypothetical protein